MTIETMIKCNKCEGVGQVADTEEQEPWTTFDDHSDVALGIMCGTIRPITCPTCGGTGEIEADR